MRRFLAFLAAAALAAALVIGLTQAGEGTEPRAPRGFDLDAARQELAGAPAPLAGLHAQSNRLLEGGASAFDKRLKALRGHPVVVNKWASWCGPCRAEFPIFQRVAIVRGREVAFLGVDGNDKRPAAEAFLADYPIPFPSYEDPDEAISRSLGVPANYPATVFIDERGKTVYKHLGGYRTDADLVADIDRHLG